MLRQPKEQVYQGIPVSRGIVFGPVHISARGFAAPEVHSISAASVPREKRRFEEALVRTKAQLSALRKQIESISGQEDDARIFEAHLMVLEDSSVLKRVATRIEEHQQNAEYSFYAVMQSFLEAMRRIPDPYLRERTVDIEDVCQRVLRNFGTEEEDDLLNAPTEEHVLIAYDVTPSDTVAMDRHNILGFATEQGSPNSHTAILARSLGIPAIVGLKNAVFNLHALTPCILDGYTGKLIAYPSEETRARYQTLLAEKAARKTELAQLREAESVTLDGQRITLAANIEFDHELDHVIASGAEGVGLFRTEFFLLEGEESPTEEQQTALYSSIAKKLAPQQVIFRTLDAGGDKLPGEPLTTPEPNPFLGWRGIRFSLARQGLFKEQLRAILRASAHGKVGIMFPLVSSVSEVREAKILLQECREELTARGEAFDPNLAVGVMIEVPSAALVADRIAREVDFLSIGTNDLIQYTCAVDRINPLVSDLYRPTHPGVISLIGTTVRGGDASNIWTGLCGEMAGDIRLLPLLLGLGVTELSVSSQLVPLVKRAIRSLNHQECCQLAEASLEEDATSQDVFDRTLAFAQKAYPELL
jgi:phosphotransferase system enzyme I (PtsI)